MKETCISFLNPLYPLGVLCTIHRNSWNFPGPSDTDESWKKSYCLYNLIKAFKNNTNKYFKCLQDILGAVQALLINLLNMFKQE